ncbi:putative S-adenosylmethionine-dependent methyltransferase/MSMEI_2290 [Planctomycetes bacterium Poly30]|uniref:Putative S-adenosylmethionine-dependent methyltransferase/MSMEI_2290 n=2 Tax=Saltatorellus ferox TaxID=2528018 RepID=A0A518EZH8_9BACT|nr:putative S-adenosylmethionine-dependent methyltransferase/MSMEI_2290 [Planctomycetes bacterium Poly30]
MDQGLAIDIVDVRDEVLVVNELLRLDDRDILELGCGRAEKTRAIAGAGTGRRVVALEVDETQHALNLHAPPLQGVRFELGGAEAIPAPDGSFDAVLMFKSLHHVPVEQMDAALQEIARVLRPGGLAYLSEPIFRDEFNGILRLFHDESHVRAEAFGAVCRSVESGALELVSQTFFRSPISFSGFDDFEQRVVGATHTEFERYPEVRDEVRAAFARFEGAGGAQFEQPIRVDLLRRPAPGGAGRRFGSAVPKPPAS